MRMATIVETEFITLQRQLVLLYDHHFGKKNNVVSIEEKKELLNRLRRLRKRYSYLAEQVYNFKNCNDEKYLFLVNLFHSKISTELGIYNENHPFYDKKDFNRKKRTIRRDDVDYTKGDFERLIPTHQ